MNYFGCEFKDETITLTKPNEEVSIRDCVFDNCHFDINKPSFVYLKENKYFNCTFNLDLTSCKKSIEIDHDEITNYPEVKEYLDKIIPSKCPKNKDFYGYKILFDPFQYRYFLAKLQIDAETLTANNGVVDKCRAEKVRVISIHNITNFKEKGPGDYEYVFHKCFHHEGQNTEYTVGHIVYADKWDSNRFNVCTSGIHFYLDPIIALCNQWGCEKALAKEIISTINEIEPDFYQRSES